jgi:hypothetical protein
VDFTSVPGLWQTAVDTGNKYLILQFVENKATMQDSSEEKFEEWVLDVVKTNFRQMEKNNYSEKKKYIATILALENFLKTEESNKILFSLMLDNSPYFSDRDFDKVIRKINDKDFLYDQIEIILQEKYNFDYGFLDSILNQINNPKYEEELFLSWIEKAANWDWGYYKPYDFRNDMFPYTAIYKLIKFGKVLENKELANHALKFAFEHDEGPIINELIRNGAGEDIQNDTFIFQTKERFNDFIRLVFEELYSNIKKQELGYNDYIALYNQLDGKNIFGAEPKIILELNLPESITLTQANVITTKTCVFNLDDMKHPECSKEIFGIDFQDYL